MKPTNVSQLSLLYWVWVGDYNGLGISLCPYRLICVNVHVRQWIQAFLHKNRELQLKVWWFLHHSREFPLWVSNIRCLGKFSLSHLFVLSAGSTQAKLWLAVTLCIYPHEGLVLEEGSYPMSLSILQKSCPLHSHLLSFSLAVGIKWRHLSSLPTEQESNGLCV